MTPSTPTGSLDRPVQAASLVLGAGATFVARVPDVAQARMVEVLKAAHDHAGTGFVEILQNCHVYNDGAFAAVTDKTTAAERALWCRPGEPLLYANGTKGLRFDLATLDLVAFTLGEDGLTEADAMVHDPNNLRLAQMLASLATPTALGVLYQTAAPTFDGAHAAARPAPRADLQALLNGRETWVVG